ncbi:MAG: DNA polymerase III subunit delta' [Burkholderiaceae bacterium]
MVNSAQLPWLAQPLRQALASARSHALLVQGPAGVGQFDLALLLAQAWLCEAPRADGSACEACASCRLFHSHTHPDFQLLVPEALRESLGWGAPEGEGATPAKESKTKPSREIKIDAVRAMLSFAQATSARGRAKVVVVYPAEALNTVAANALLKTLEEPAGRLRFVLASSAPEALLPTIRSRCQPLPLALPDRAPALQWLAEQGVEAPEILLAAAGGRPQEARDWFEAGLRAQAWLQLPQRLARGEAQALADWPQPRAIDALQRLSHDLLRRAHGAPPSYFPADSLPSPKLAAPLLAWDAALRRAARHAEHPLNAGLLMESRFAQGHQALREASPHASSRRGGAPAPGSTAARNEQPPKPLGLTPLTAPGAAPGAAPAPAPRTSVIQLAFKEKGALYAAYMPMFTDGGLFVPTSREYRLGEDIYLLLALPEDNQRYPVAGKVAWLTPANASGGRTQGVGVRFPADEKSRLIKLKIEEILGTQISSSKPTQTI